MYTHRRLALQLYCTKDGHYKCLTATVGNKPFPTAVKKAVLTTDLNENLGPGRYWLVLQVDLHDSDDDSAERTTASASKRQHYISLGVYNSGSGTVKLPDIRNTDWRRPGHQDMRRVPSQRRRGAVPEVVIDRSASSIARTVAASRSLSRSSVNGPDSDERESFKVTDVGPPKATFVT